MLALLLILALQPGDAKSEALAVLADFHQAASQADRARYFGLLAENAVFLGTDASERWTKSEFEAKYGPYMDSGKGWTFTPVEQFVTLSADGQVAWFDERLDSASYGVCRGSGVLVKQGERWLISQYNLTIPIPNDLANEFVVRIRELKPTAK